MVERRNTRQVMVGLVPIGDSAPVVVQSMTNTDTRDVDATVGQIARLVEAGCEVVRVAVPDRDAVQALHEIKQQIKIPLVADIHFNYKLALGAIESGADKLRINPGNIGATERVEAVVRSAKEHGIPIRIGVNAGSIEKRLLQKYGGPTSEALVESALAHVAILERLHFEDIVLSLKASDVPLTLAAYRMISQRVNYPLHIGITEAGTLRSGTIRSAVGIGVLLASGIGDTIRVSLAGNPVEEIPVAYEILKALHLRERGPTIIACPTCGRTEIDLVSIANEVERRTAHLRTPLKIAVMGCVVNGPGEAREADIGIAGGKGVGLIFRHGKTVRKVRENEIVDALMEEIETLVKTH